MWKVFELIAKSFPSHDCFKHPSVIWWAGQKPAFSVLRPAKELELHCSSNFTHVGISLSSLLKVWASLYIEFSANTHGSPPFLPSLTLPPQFGQLREFRRYQKGGHAEMVLQTPGNADGYTKVSELKSKQMWNYC